MFIFKTSGRTLDSVVRNAKHAFSVQPRSWSAGELVLVSKNRQDCQWNERQIRYLMTLSNVRPLRPGEAELYWPGTEGRWRYLVECKDVRPIERPFDLVEVLGDKALEYRQVMTFKKLKPPHERLVLGWLDRSAAA